MRTEAARPTDAAATEVRNADKGLAEFSAGGGCLHERFERQVARDPDAIAISFEGVHLSYGEVNSGANRLAHRLRALGIGPDTVVGLCVDRSPDLVVGVLAILKAGGAYLALDARQPEARL